MSDLNPYVDLDKRKLTDESGTAFTLPTLVHADKLKMGLRGLRHTADGVRTVALRVRTLKASIGPTLAPPTAGGAKLRFGSTIDDPETAQVVNFATTASALLTALTDVHDDWTPAEVVLADTACWLVRFTEQGGAAPLQVGTANTLTPRAAVRVRAYQLNGVWWHEVRFIQAPLAFTSAFVEELPPAPSIAELQEGGSDSDSDDIIVNEIQQITVPRDFRGTYVIKWEGRVSSILGTQDGPEETAAALNAMWADGKERFAVTNAEDDKGNIEFIGLLGDEPQALMEVEVKSFDPGAPTFTLDLETAEMGAALRIAAALTTTTLLLATMFELQIEYVDEDEDPEDEEIPSRYLTCQLAVNVAREQIYDEVEEVHGIDWLNGFAKDYIPFSLDQVITGQQHYTTTLGNGVATAFAITHNLDTEALSGIEVRENMSGGRVLGRTEYAIVVNSADQITVTFAVAPTSAQYAICITTAGPASAFQSHTHSIGQVTGLQDALDALGARLSIVEDLVPSATLVRPAETDTPAEFEIPDTHVLFPNARVPKTFSIASLAEATPAILLTLPRAPGLLPAIHDATITSIASGTLPSPTEGSVYQNDHSARILLPGGGGRRSKYLEVGAFAGHDGRYWYRVTRGSASSNSFFPTDFEHTLIPPLTFALETWAAGDRLLLEFDLALQTFLATTDVQWTLVIEHGALPSEADPVGSALDLTTAGTGTHTLTRDGVTIGTFTVNTGTDVVTLTAHGLTDDDTVRLSSSTTLPAPLAAGIDYVIRDATTNTFKLAAATNTRNLRDVVWNATPLLAQPLVASALKQNRHFGCLIKRSASNVMTAEKLIQNAWAVADSCPVSPSFAVRVRLARFDTENSITGEVGYAFAALTEATATVG